MELSRWHRQWEIFHAVLELPLEQRSNALAELCRDDPELKREISATLKAHDSGSPLDQAPLGLAPQPALPQHFGPWRVCRELGRGGMGVVLEVERTDGEYRQRAALKLIEPMFAHGATLDRFRRERQLLARLRHPNIARLLDGGHTEDGRPWLVMDYIEGVPIDRWCEQRRADLKTRLQLLGTVCQAVDFAHRQLVLHLDLKPSNILVSHEGVPILLDFGIARSLDSGDTERTEIGEARPLTSAYASPEQLEGTPHGLACDVYSLGVLSFELVSGELPYASTGLSWSELAQRLRAGTPPSLKAHRKKLKLPLELDWICARAMHPEPAARYPTAQALADDLSAVIEHRAPSARPASRLYRARKFMRRHWPWMLAGSVFVATVAAFTTRLALEAEATRTALNATEIERDRAQRVATFLSELFRAGDTTQSGGQALSAQELLDRARHAMAGNPELPAPSRLLLLNTLAEVYRNLGRYAESEQLLREAQQWLPQQRSPLMQAETLENLGIVYELSGQSKRARSVLTEALSLLEQVEHADQDARARVSERLATSLQSLGEHEAAGALFERAWAARRSLAVNDPRRAESALRYGSWHWVAGRFEQAAEFYAMALATRRAEQPANLPELARTLDAVAAAKHAQGNLAAALPLYAESLELRRRVLGEKHRLTADSLSNIGALHVDRGTPQDAITPLQEALGIYAQVLPADSVVPAKTHNNLGLALHAQKSWDEAQEHFERALALNRASYGPEHPRVAGNLNNLALVFEQRQHMAEAERALSQALQILERAQGASHVGLAFPLTNMGRIALWRNQLESARNLLERALKIRRQALPQAHRLLADTLFWLALTRCAEGEQASGLVALNEAQQSYLAHRDQEAITDVAAVRAVCQPDYAWPAAEREAWQQRRGQHDPLVAWVQTRLQ